MLAMALKLPVTEERINEILFKKETLSDQEQFMLKYLRLAAQHRIYITTHKGIDSPFLETMGEMETRAYQYELFMDDLDQLITLVTRHYPTGSKLNGLVAAITKRLG